MSDWYQLENKFLTAQFCSKGAELKRLFVKTWNSEIMWQADPHVWARTAPILFPIVGALKNDTYCFAGKNYKLPKHGFARDLEFSKVIVHEDAIEFYLTHSSKTIEMYPFQFQLKIFYQLVNNSVRVDYEVTNLNQQEMFFSIGAHPGFNMNPNKKNFIEFDSEEKGFRLLEENLYNSKQTYTELDDPRKIDLSKGIFNNDALIFDSIRSQSVSFVNESDRRKIKISFSKIPYLGIWGKEEMSFVCLEPWWGVTDEISSSQKIEEKLGINKLKSKETFKVSYSITVENF